MKDTELKELFKHWRDDDNYKNEVERIKRTIHFVEDGIIDEDKYDNADFKILFVLRDPHDEKGNEESLLSIFESADKYKGNGQTWNNTVRWAYALLEKDACYDNVKNIGFEHVEKYMQQTAVMNLKKASGGSRAEYIENFTKSQSEFISKEIEIISPDIIVTCEEELLSNHILEVDKSNSYSRNKGAFYTCTASLKASSNKKEFKIINLYHPSARYSSEDMLNFILEAKVHFEI